MQSLRGRLLVEGALVPGTLTWERGRIVSIEPWSGPADDLPIVAPGLIDLHVHGFGGADPLHDLAGMSRALAAAGTTAFQPTLFPAHPAALGEAAAAMELRAKALSEGAKRGARVLGAHLEGPFVNPLAAGALPSEDLCTPSPAALRALLGPAMGGGRAIRTVTVAPELPGAVDLIRELGIAGIRVSLGHSRATAAQSRVAARAGASGVTHLYNAMAPFHQREAGLAGFALTDAALHAELIGDLVHVGAEAVQLALRARGALGLCLVSDALRGAGTGCERFSSHGREHLVKDGAAWYPPAAPGEEPKLAGSALSQLEMVRRLVSRGVVALPEAILMASTAPARALSMEDELGALRPGLAADFLALRGKALELQGVWIAGERVAGSAATSD